MFEVTIEDIRRLKDWQLTKLLKRLLYLEANTHKLPERTVHVSLNINVADGGEDGRIEWEGGPDHTEYLPSRLTLFQCKATEMGPTDCKKEILSSINTLKPQVESVLNKPEGSYVLFCSQALTKQQIETRIEKFREAINDTGKAYASIVKIVILDANRIVDWTNCYIAAIRIVYGWCGKSLPFGMKIWDQWASHQILCRFPYIPSNTNQENIRRLRQHFLGSCDPIRIIGLSGLGKTRLALEVFRPHPTNPTIEDQILSKNTVYIDLSGYQEDELKKAIGIWAEMGLEGIIVIDNCSYELYQNINFNLAYYHHKLKLFTLNYEPVQTEIPNLIRLQPESDDIISAILRQAYPTMHLDSLQRIVDFAQGFPQMAILLADAHLEDYQTLSGLPDEILTSRLLWGRGLKNELAEQIISFCALFNEFGWEGSAEKQCELMARVTDFTTDRLFYRWISDFKTRGILDTHGNCLQVVPKPLALQLAESWLKKNPSTYLLQIINQLPKEMLQQMGEQFYMSAFLPKVGIIEILCNQQLGLLSIPKILNSINGTYLIRYLADLKPLLVLYALNNLLPQIEILRVECVDNLLLAIQKLCFRKDDFSQACNLFLSFILKVSTERQEEIKQHFLQLFQIEYSGTEVTLDKKFTVINQLSSADLPQWHYQILIEALGQAIQSMQLPRNNRAEFQNDGKMLQEWRPQSGDEQIVFTYRKNSLLLLVELATENTERGQAALLQIKQHIHDIQHHELSDEIPISIKQKIGIETKAFNLFDRHRKRERIVDPSHPQQIGKRQRKQV